jgi:hypothetical protein
MFGIRNLRKPRELSQPNQLDMVGERGFEPPTPWPRTNRNLVFLLVQPQPLRIDTENFENFETAGMDVFAASHPRWQKISGYAGKYRENFTLSGIRISVFLDSAGTTA